jgi:hypothetical protein
MAKSRLVGRALKRLRAPVTDLIATGLMSALCGIPLVGSPDETRVELVSTASPRRSGQAVPPSEDGQAVRTHHAARRSENTRIETLRRQAIEGTVSTPRGLPSLERLRPLERSALRALQSLADTIPGPGGSSRKRARSRPTRHRKSPDLRWVRPRGEPREAGCPSASRQRRVRVS